MEAFNDDELNIPNSSGSGVQSPEGLLYLTSVFKKKAPLEANTQTGMLTLTGKGSALGREGLDLVAVLDVSGSMRTDPGDKMGKMKLAMQFLIKKLSDIDRLSIIVFSDTAARKFPLGVMTDAYKTSLLQYISSLYGDGNTNITDGIQKAVRVLDDRRLSGDRTTCIMLLSDGHENIPGANAAAVKIDRYTVHTFGFGKDHDAKLLSAVARNGKPGGTFHFVRDGEDLTAPFSQVVAGLLTTRVRDLVLKVKPKGTGVTLTVDEPAAYKFLNPPNRQTGEVSIGFGDLSIDESRSIIVRLSLPAVAKEKKNPSFYLEATYSYSSQGGFDAPPAKYAPMSRIGQADQDDSSPSDKREVRIELGRQNHARLISDARVMVDAGNQAGALLALQEAQNKLEDLPQQAAMMVDMLRVELVELITLVNQGLTSECLAYALAAESSHACQRFASRGDAKAVRLFCTPRMDTYLDQATKFAVEPEAPLPTDGDDVKTELAANPLAPFTGPIAYHIGEAIRSLQAVQSLLLEGAAGDK
ncbi:hypothetical protein EJB05_34063 [Eragrostis curvula]|uniref:VWFA domain-containing protein n=1 Tax=Eragrostis curvula TaxID=38414 RepID=A0A5J9U423_9POAL|nr:hypothetical protein EJB05_34060 [Eragrostis curvula]TVU17998.1 hypothetical protein EJB05_34063 [Eragrostis curvula]